MDVDILIDNESPVVDIEVANRAGSIDQVLRDDTMVGDGVTEPLGVNPDIIPDVSDFATKDELQTVESVIPATANAQNQLADQGFVNSSIQTSTAHFRGNWDTWADVPSDPALYPVDAYGNHAPTPNDYLVVVADEQGGTWRYKYTGLWSEQGKDGWQAEYQVNETPLTAAQLAALNSGITADAVASFVKKTDYATETNKAGIVYPISNAGLRVTSSGGMYIANAPKDYIDRRASEYRPITPTNLDYAVKTSVTTNTIELTDDEKTAARTWLGAVGNTDIAGDGKLGLVRASAYNGSQVTEGGTFRAHVFTLAGYSGAVANVFVGKGTLENIKNDLVKRAVTTNDITLTDDEKAAAQAWLGIDTLIGDIESALAEV